MTSEHRVFALHNRSRPLPGRGSRTILRLYFAGVGGIGAIVFGWGPLWVMSPMSLGTRHLADQPFGNAALVRAFGSIILAAAFCAAGFAAVDDPRARHKGLMWFAAAHLVVFMALLVQRITIWGPGSADFALWLLVAAIVVLVMAEFEYPVTAVIRALGGSAPSPAERLRSAHDRQIREAAGQEERNRLARDLHDSIKQQIFAIQTAAATVETRFDTDAAGARLALEQVRAAARDAMTEMEVMLDHLRAVPLANAGLVEALKKQCEALGFRTGARVDVSLGSLPPDDALPEGAQHAMLRVAQEALANVARHARAGSVRVSLDCARGRLALVVEDDGAGFDARQGRRGMGMENMATRATEIGGSLELTSYPDRGTVVRFSVPYAAEARSRYLGWAVLCAVLLMGSIANLRNEVTSSATMAALAAVGLTWSVTGHRLLRRRPEAAR